MAKKLSDSLSQFLSSSSNSFDDPFKENSDSKSSMKISEFMEHTDEIKKERKKEKKPKKTFEEELDELVGSISDTFAESNAVDDLEGYLSEYLLDDEDEEFRRNLVRFGRKYARNTSQSGEKSEIQKAYAEAETALSKLIQEVADDKEALQKDITQMRTSRSRNYKTFADLIEAKTSMHTTQLNAIKEVNAITKNKFELQMKADKSKKDNEEDSTVANRMIQGLFGMGRSNLISSYEEVSGALDDNYDSSDTLSDDGLNEEAYFDDVDMDKKETDGDKFLKYEGIFSHYVLEYDDNGPIQIVAEDIDGNVIPDYPVSNIKELEFNISESTGTATDNLSQRYKLRKIEN